MKVKTSKEIKLTADSTYVIPLNTFKAGDTVARELIISYDGECSISADNDEEPYGIDCQLNTGAFNGSMMIIPCEMYTEIQVVTYEDGILSYKILV